MGTPTYLKPEFSDFENCIGYAKELYQHTGGICSEDELGRIVGNKTTSSWFTLKLNAMRAYGLVEFEGDRIKITKLAESIIRPKDEKESTDSVLAALRAFPMFTSLVNRYDGKGEPASSFVANTLESEGKAKSDKAKDWALYFLKAARFSRLFQTRNALPSIEDKPAQPPPPNKRLGEDQLLTDDEVQEGWLVYPVPVAKGVARIIVPRNLPRPVWEKMKKLLDAIEPENKNGPEGPS